MKSENSGAQEIEISALPGLKGRHISAPKCFKTEVVGNKRLFFETFMHYGTRFQFS